MTIHHTIKIVINSLILSAMIISPAYAYLDPGTGSLLIQGLLGGIAGATVFIRIYWHKITSWFNGSKSGDDEEKE